MKEFTKGSYSVRMGYKIGYEGVSVYTGDQKPNEDSFACGIDRKGRFTAGVFDGVKTLSGGPSFPSPEVTSGKLVSSFLAHTLLEYTDLNLHEAFVHMNAKRRELNKYLKPLQDVGPDHLPAAGGTVIRINPELRVLDYAYIGNTKLIVELKTGKKEILSDPNNEKCNQLFIKEAVRLAELKGISLQSFASTNPKVLERLKRNHIIANFNSEGGNGFGIFNGDPAIEKHIHSGSYEIDDITRLLLATDGIFPAMLDLSKQDDLTRIVDASFRLGLMNVIQIKNRLNAQDPEWKNYPRISASDDATALAVSISRDAMWNEIYGAVGHW